MYVLNFRGQSFSRPYLFEGCRGSSFSRECSGSQALHNLLSRPRLWVLAWTCQTEIKNVGIKGHRLNNHVKKDTGMSE